MNKEQQIISILINYFGTNIDKVEYKFVRGFLLEIDNPKYNEPLVIYRSLEDRYEVCIGNTHLEPDDTNKAYIDSLIRIVRDKNMFRNAELSESRKDDLLKFVLELGGNETNN